MWGTEDDDQRSERLQDQAQLMKLFFYASLPEPSPQRPGGGISRGSRRRVSILQFSVKFFNMKGFCLAFWRMSIVGVS